MDAGIRIQLFQQFFHLSPNHQYLPVFRLDGIHMNHQKNSQFFHGFPFNPVNDLMGSLNIHIIRHFCMDTRHTAVRSVIMYDQVMGSYDPVIFFHIFFNFLIDFRIYCLADQRFQRVFRNRKSCPHYDQCHAQAHEGINIYTSQAIDDQRQNRCRCRNHVSHGIGKYRHHHLGLNFLPQFPVKYTQPQLHPNRQQQDCNRNCLKMQGLRMPDLGKRVLKKGKAHFHDQKCHDQSRDIFHSSVSEGMLLICRFFSHFDSDKTDDRRSCIRQIIKRIRRDRHTVQHQSQDQFHPKQKYIAKDADHTGQYSIGRADRHLFHRFMILYKMCYQKFCHLGFSVLFKPNNHGILICSRI